MILHVSDQDLPGLIHRHSPGRFELPVPNSLAAKFAKKRSSLRENLNAIVAIVANDHAVSGIYGHISRTIELT
jgi:hypothetical protein